MTICYLLASKVRRMIGIMNKKSDKGEVCMTSSFATQSDAKEITNFINEASRATNGRVAPTYTAEVMEQISTAAVIMRDMNSNKILGYNGSSTIGRYNNAPVVAILPGISSEGFVGHAVNGEAKAIIIDSIRDKHPDAVIIAMKREANANNGKLEAIKELGFVSHKGLEIVDNYRNDAYMEQFNISDNFWDFVKKSAAGDRVWIGIQTKDTYDAYSAGFGKPKEAQQHIIEESSKKLLSSMFRNDSALPELRA